MTFIEHLKRHDWGLIVALAVLAVVSLTTLSTISPELFWKQAVWFAIGFFIIITVSRLDLHTIVNYRFIIIGFYVITLALLMAALVFAPEVRETKSWFVFGPLRFQPSELAKISLIIILSSFFARRHIGIAHLRNLAASFFYFFLPVVIVFLQPDWGSALVFVGIWIGFLLVSGIRWMHLFFGMLVFMLFIIVSWNFLLRPYQRERVIGFFQPSYDPSGINYSVNQSKIAIGSAGFFGKGYGQGTQTQLGFLTEPATDFAFAAFVEEWGFAGAIVLVSAFLVLVFRIIRLGLAAEDNFSRFVSLGATMLFLFEFMLNIGSNLGLVPVVGVTLPFVSYGGSSLLTKALLVGIIQTIPVKPRF